MNAIESPALQVPETIGAPFEGGFYGGQIQIGAAVFAIVWAPKGLGETKAAGLDKYESVPGAVSCNDSWANTQAMAAAGSPLGAWATALEINGLAGWCVPARDVLEMAYRYLKPTGQENGCTFRDGDNASSIPVGYPYTEDSPMQTSVSAFQEGGAEAFEETLYWSSTQFSAYDAFGQRFDDGDQSYGDKKYEGRCRAVRMIQLSPSDLQSFNAGPATNSQARADVARAVKAPAIGARWPGHEGVYAGVSRGEDGQADAHLVLLDAKPDTDLKWAEGVQWGESLGDGARLPTRFESALLYANLRDQIDTSAWHWTGSQYSASHAFGQGFYYGGQHYYDKEYEGRCRAVRRFVL